MSVGTIPTLILFTRVPAPGFSKTRLVPRLGPAGAADFQWELLARLLDRLGEGHRRGSWRLSVHYALPSDADEGGLEKLRAMVPTGVATVPQVAEADLGKRMRAAIDSELSLGAPAVGLMGSDMPAVAAEAAARALGLLRDPGIDVVLCPVEDGGYWFVGMREPLPQLFEGKTYGCPTVLEDALAACAACGRRACLGPTLRDIDTPDDLDWYRSSGR